jgi:hypothetical protein
MIQLTRKARRATLLALAAGVVACGSDGPTETGVQPPTGVQVTATGASSVRITFTGRAGDASYVIERARVGTTTTFAAIATVPAPAGGGAVTFDDVGLEANTSYQYRLATVRGGQTSSTTTAVSVTTAPAGRFAADITGDVTADRRLTADTVYTLKGFVHVANGATLTIDPGTVIKGDYNTLGSSLFVLRGAKINAVGTATSPIVFTSSQPVGQRHPGDWGGLILVGNGVINRSGTIAVEGTGGGSGPGTNYTVNYSGGTSNDDNSGELRYVRVEFAGFAPVQNQELNSFTFAAVGKNTKLSYLQAIAGLDDSFEWFGGAVDGDHLVSYESGDDHFDMSESYRGRLQYLIAFQSTQLTPRPGAVGALSGDPQGIENDGCAGQGCDNGFNSQPFTIPVVANFTIVGTGTTASSGAAGGIGMMLRRGTGGYYVNGIVARWPRFGVSLRDPESYARAGSTGTQDLATADLALKNVLFVQTPAVFETGSNSTTALDLAGNSLIQNAAATTASLFVKFPATTSASTTEADFDWSLASGAPAASGGLSTFSGKLATAAAGASPSGNTVAGTAYLGAVAPGGAKWWEGWTRYVQQ